MINLLLFIILAPPFYFMMAAMKPIWGVEGNGIVIGILLSIWILRSVIKWWKTT